MSAHNIYAQRFYHTVQDSLEIHVNGTGKTQETEQNMSSMVKSNRQTFYRTISFSPKPTNFILTVINQNPSNSLDFYLTSISHFIFALHAHYSAHYWDSLLLTWKLLSGCTIVCPRYSFCPAFDCFEIIAMLFPTLFHNCSETSSGWLNEISSA